MGKARFNKTLLDKVARKLKKSIQDVRVGICHRAARWDMTSEAAQVRWAKDLGISTVAAFRSLSPQGQQQVREHRLPQGERAGRVARELRGSRRTRRGSDAGFKEAIRAMLANQELRDRCADLLIAKEKFDRPINQATLVLESRLRELSGVQGSIMGLALVSKALNPRNPLLRVSDDDDVQDGIHSICRGVVSALRNPTHHHLTDKVTREDALKVCGFVDHVLRILAQGKRVQHAAGPRPAPAGPGDRAAPVAAASSAGTYRGLRPQPSRGFAPARRRQREKDLLRRRRSVRAIQ